jgi:hypothetical protein
MFALLLLLQAHHWTILGIIVLSCRVKQLMIAILQNQSHCTNDINEPRQLIGLCFYSFEVQCTANCLVQQADLDGVCNGEWIGVLFSEVELLTPVGNKVLVGSSPQTIINGNSIEIIKDLLAVVFGLSRPLGLGYHFFPHLQYGISIISV